MRQGRGRQALAAAALVALALAGVAAAATLQPSSGSSASVDCSGTGAIKNISVTVSGGTATARFDVVAGCTGIRVSLASYRASSATGGFPQTYNDSSTGVFSAGGPFTLTASVASCFYEVDLVEARRDREPGSRYRERNPLRQSEVARGDGRKPVVRRDTAAAAALGEADQRLRPVRGQPREHLRRDLRLHERQRFGGFDHGRQRA